MNKQMPRFVKIRGNGHARCMAQSIFDSWEKECYSNVKLIAKDHKQDAGIPRVLSANKVVLAAASKKFATMLADTEDDVTIIVPDHSYSTLKLLLQYIYSGQILVQHFPLELQTLIAEWGVCYPQVIPKTADLESITLPIPPSTQVQSANTISKLPSSAPEKTADLESITLPIQPSTPVRSANTRSKLPSSAPAKTLVPAVATKKLASTVSTQKTGNLIKSYQKSKSTLRGNQTKAPIVCIDIANDSNAEESCSMAEVPLEQQQPAVTPPGSIAETEETCGENSQNSISEETPSTSRPNDDGTPVGSLVRRRTTKQRSASSATRPNGYVFLATYIKNSKNRVLPKVIPQKTSLKGDSRKAGKKVLKSAKKSKTLTDVNANGEKENMADDEINVESPNTSVEMLEPEEADTEEDLQDLGLASNILKSEKVRHQELTATMRDLSNQVLRHKSYVKHFLGDEGIESSKPSAVRIPCKTCGKSVHRDYMPHHVKIHTSERPYLCDQCGRTFALPERLRTHLKYTHADESQLKLHVCPDCGKAFKKADYLQRHITLHNGKKPYQCPFCSKSFRLPNVLLKHKRTHTGERPYECETCHKRFSARTNYVVHLRTHRKKSRVLESSETTNFVDPETQLLKCDVCDTTFHREYAFLVHKAAHKGEEPKLPCRHCQETFGSYKLLKEHTQNQHADALFQCEHCPSMFVNKTALQSHTLIHTQGKNLPCSLCDKKFKTKVQLETHRRSVHTDDRPFTCRFCDKNFKSKLTLRQHERIHTGERPYQCPHCPKAFRQDVHLGNHLRLHTGEKPFVCNYCSKAFAHKNNLSIHIKIHTGDKNQCNVCGKVFRTIVKLRLHESTHTPPSVPIEEVEEEMEEETV